MMNFRNNRVLWVGGGVCTVLLLVACVFLFRANADFQRQSRLLERQYRRLNELNTRSVFPSLENVEQLKQNVERVEYQAGELAAQLAQEPLPPDSLDAADFSAKAQGVIERFGRRAKQLGVVLPTGLEAGFGPYASGGAVPEERYVPRLSRQLYSVEKVADVLVRGGVHSIDALTRDAFEAQSAKVESAGSRRRHLRHSDPLPAVQDDLREVASAADPGGLYYIERVGAVFTAKEEDVWRVLDLLAAAPHFMVVAEFSSTTQTDILAYDPDAVKRGEVGDDEAMLKFLAGGILSGKQALSRPERIIAGNELIRVSLAVDVFNFEPGRDGEGAP